MSWINSNATYKQSSKNDLSFYHGFSKTPVEPASNGTAATKLGNASTKSGHTVIGSEVWAEEIPWFGLVASKDSGVSRLSGRTKLNDLVKVVDQNNQIYKYIGEENATFTKENWDSYWTPITIKNGDTIVNADGVPVLRYYEGQPMQVLTSENNAGITSNGYATRLFVNEDTHLGQTSGGSVVSQFAAGTDNIKNGIPSAELNPVLYYGTTKKEAGTHYYDYNVSGTVLWNENVTSKGVKISCFRYIGKTVTGQLSSISSSVKTHTNDISAIKAQLGMGGGGEDGTPSVTDRVDANEAALKVLLGLAEGSKIEATESIATTAANAISTSLAGDTDGTIGKAIADAKKDALDAINAIQHFSVEIVPEGQTIENVTPLVENTIYLVKDANAAEGTYIEYIAYKPAGSESVVTEKIGSTAIDLSGYTTDAEYNALAGETGRVTVLEGKVTTLTGSGDGSVAKALADAKTYAETQASAAKSGAETTAANALSAARTEITAEIAQAKAEAIAGAEVTITAGTGIVVTGEGKGTTFQIAVSDDVATAAALSALSQVVASNKTELEGKITAAETAASTALETAKTEIKGTTDALDTRLQTAEGKVSTLEGQVATLTGSGDNSVAKQIETAATDIKGQSLEQTGTLSGMFTVQTTGTVGEGITAINISDAGLGAAITKAKTDAETTAANALSAARGEITTEIGTAVSDLKTELTTGDNSLGGKVTALENSVKTINETTIPNAITTAKTQTLGTAITTATGKDAETSPKVTVQLSGTVQTPSLTVTTDDIASAQALSALETKVNNFHKAGVSYVVTDTLPTIASGTESTYNGKVYLVNTGLNGVVAADGSRIEYMYVNKGSEGSPSWDWEQIGTTKTDLSDYATNATIEAMDADLTVNGISVKQVNGTVTELSESLIAASVPAGTTSVEGNIAYVGSIKHVIAPEKFQTAAQMPTSLTSWVADMGNLEEASSSFKGCSSLDTFIGDLSSLTNGSSMFDGCSSLDTFIGDLSSLTNGSSMFKGCTSLTSFDGDLSSLTNGQYMFGDGAVEAGGTGFCQLDIDSIECIANTIRNVDWQTGDEIEGPPLPGQSYELWLGLAPAVDISERGMKAIQTIKSKGWTVYINGTPLA